MLGPGTKQPVFHKGWEVMLFFHNIPAPNKNRIRVRRRMKDKSLEPNEGIEILYKSGLRARKQQREREEWSLKSG